MGEALIKEGEWVAVTTGQVNRSRAAGVKSSLFPLQVSKRS